MEFEISRIDSLELGYWKELRKAKLHIIALKQKEIMVIDQRIAELVRSGTAPTSETK